MGQNVEHRVTSISLFVRFVLQTPRKEHKCYKEQEQRPHSAEGGQCNILTQGSIRELLFIPSASDVRWRSKGMVRQFAHGQPSRTLIEISILAFEIEGDHPDLPNSSPSLHPPNAIGPAPSSHGQCSPKYPWTSSSALEASWALRSYQSGA